MPELGHLEGLQCSSSKDFMEKSMKISEDTFQKDVIEEIKEINESLTEEEANVIEDTVSSEKSEVKEKVCSICGKPAFVESKNGNETFYLCESHYVKYKKHNKLNKPIVRKEKKIGRNDACPCGSGKKYKKCCADFK